METYTFLRELADSWVLLAMTLFFLGMVFWTFRPGAKAAHDDISRIPLRNEDAPAEEETDCPGRCPDCKSGGACKTFDFGVRT